MLNSSPIFPSGTLVDERYEVLKALGVGGMGSVLLAKDRFLDDEPVAVKILFPHHAIDKIQFARFKNEVILARKLSHPNIVQIFDLGSWNNYSYISMEFVEGRTLSDHIYGKGVARINFSSAIEVLLQISEAMASAHKLGIVHRDLKPDNILVTPAYLAKVTDFGLARALDTDNRFTMTGETVGTPYYMSPEQLAGELPDSRVDIYSLGILTYEILVARRPFESKIYMELAQMHMTQAFPDIRAINSSIPMWCKEFVEVCCEKRPEDRFANGAEAEKFLLEYADEKVIKKVFRIPSVLSLAPTEFTKVT